MTYHTLLDTEDFEHNGHKFRMEMHLDAFTGAPWEEHDGHGPVSDWTTRSKSPGEMVLNSDRGSYRYYDFQEAVKIAKRDGWGVSAHHLEFERGANGLTRVTGQWFVGKELRTFTSAWCDDNHVGIAQCYEQFNETVTLGQKAALAAMQDYKYLSRWCNDDWQWVGIEVFLLDDEGDLLTDQSESLWGIESDDKDHIKEIREELAEQLLCVIEDKLMLGLRV